MATAELRSSLDKFATFARSLHGEEQSEALARLMDAGKLPFAELESKSWQSEWLRVGVRVCLRDY